MLVPRRHFYHPANPDSDPVADLVSITRSLLGTFASFSS